MTHRKKTNNQKFLDEESLPENDFLTSVLSMVNGYCKVNVEVPQTSSFYTSDILLPINAKVNSFTLDSKIQKSQKSIPPDIADVLKNVESLKIDKNTDNAQSNPSSKTHVNEFQVYSKPSYSDNVNINNHIGKKEDNKRSISPKSKKKKNKFSKTDSSSASTSDNQTTELPECMDQNSSVDYYNQYENNRSEDVLRIQQEQELHKKQKKNDINNTHSLRNTESGIQNDRLPSQSQCPLCFRLYPTPDIEAHASECSI